MTNEQLPDDDEDDVLPPATQEELEEVAKLRTSHPNLFQSYLEYFADGQKEQLKITLSPSGRDLISKTKPLADDDLHLGIIRMDLQARANYLRRIQVGYEGARLIGNELTRGISALFHMRETAEGLDEGRDAT